MIHLVRLQCGQCGNPAGYVSRTEAGDLVVLARSSRSRDPFPITDPRQVAPWFTNGLGPVGHQCPSCPVQLGVDASELARKLDRYDRTGKVQSMAAMPPSTTPG